MMDIILWLYYTIVRLIVVLGVVFLDYLIYLSMKESIFLKTKAVLRKIAWIGIMIISLVILQGVPVLSENLLQDRCTTLIQNMDLQLIVLFFAYAQKNHDAALQCVRIYCHHLLLYVPRGIPDDSKLFYSNHHDCADLHLLSDSLTVKRQKSE